MTRLTVESRIFVLACCACIQCLLCIYLCFSVSCTVISSNFIIMYLKIRGCDGTIQCHIYIHLPDQRCWPDKQPPTSLARRWKLLSKEIRWIKQSKKLTGNGISFLPRKYINSWVFIFAQCWVKIEWNGTQQNRIRIKFCKWE